MAISRTAKTETELDDMMIVDAIQTFLTMQARDWRRRKMNVMRPQVLRLADEARNRGDKVNLPAFVRQVWDELPLLGGPDD